PVRAHASLPDAGPGQVVLRPCLRVPAVADLRCLPHLVHVTVGRVDDVEVGVGGRGRRGGGGRVGGAVDVAVLEHAVLVEVHRRVRGGGQVDGVAPVVGVDPGCAAGLHGHEVVRTRVGGLLEGGAGAERGVPGRVGGEGPEAGVARGRGGIRCGAGPGRVAASRVG